MPRAHAAGAAGQPRREQVADVSVDDQWAPLNGMCVSRCQPNCKNAPGADAPCDQRQPMYGASTAAITAHAMVFQPQCPIGRAGIRPTGTLVVNTCSSR